MSAAEKLEALNTPLPANLGEWGDEVRRRGATFLDALPEIIAVVKAAQTYTDYPQLKRPVATLTELVALSMALSALDEALPQIGSTSPTEGATSPKEENWRSGLWRNTR